MVQMHMMIVNYGCGTCRSKPCANSFAPMFFFSSDYNPHTDRSTFYNSQFCAEHLRPSPPKANFTPKGPPFQFFTFSRKHTKPDVPKGSPLWIFFSELCDFFSKIFVFENFFFENKMECLLINPEGSPLLHFSALCDFF